MKRQSTKTRLLKQGDVIELKAEHSVYAYVPEHFVFDNRRGEFDELTRTEISLSDPNWQHLQGEYVVDFTVEDGGGQGHGLHDIYPDGHHVHCVKLKNLQKGFKVDFYQTGSFTVMIEDIKPIRRAKKVWS